MKICQPIGIFDSGIGGLTVWNKIKALLPKERLIYLADTQFCPYGPKSVEEVRERCRYIVRYFLKRDCKLIVIACNTATAAAIEILRKEFTQMNFVGMEPAIKPAILHTRTGKVGVLATIGTFNGSLYHNTLANFAENTVVIEQVGEGWVEAVESGQLDTPETVKMVKRTLKPLLDQGVDHLVLGCTHYPFLIPIITRIAGPEVVIVDPAPAVAQRVKYLLETGNNLCDNRNGEDEFYATGPVSPAPSAVANMANGGTINWRPYTLENVS